MLNEIFWYTSSNFFLHTSSAYMYIHWMHLNNKNVGVISLFCTVLESGFLLKVLMLTIIVRQIYHQPS